MSKWKTLSARIDAGPMSGFVDYNLSGYWTWEVRDTNDRIVSMGDALSMASAKRAVWKSLKELGVERENP
jgi:hypothetical protein